MTSLSLAGRASPNSALALVGLPTQIHAPPKCAMVPVGTSVLNSPVQFIHVRDGHLYKSTSTVLQSRMQLSSLLGSPHSSWNGAKSGKTRGRQQLAVATAESGSDWEREEIRWQREEKRWLREEQRWLREEARWEKERAELNSQIAALEHERALLRASKYQVWQGPVTPPPPPPPPKAIQSNRQQPSAEEILKSIPAQDIIAAVLSRTPGGSGSFEFYEAPVDRPDVSDPSPSPAATSIPPATPQSDSSSSLLSERYIFRSLKPGAKGDDVRYLQEALMKKGFYSGEEDMEDEFFDAGTSRAVMTWQASIGVPEDGVVTPALFSTLIDGQPPPSGKEGDPGPAAELDPKSPSSSWSAPPFGSSVNGGVASAKGETATRSAPPTVQRDDPKWVSEAERFARTSVEAGLAGSSHRVFLLGEQRWEDPTRQKSSSAPPAENGTKPTQKKLCFDCRGAGTLICIECEGTGELNVEEQFLEWAGDNPKCPYCQGNSVVECETCNGTGNA